MLSNTDLKSQAKRLRSHLANHGTNLSYSQALEAIAATHGFADWNTASASTSKPEPDTRESLLAEFAPAGKTHQNRGGGKLNDGEMLLAKDVFGRLGRIIESETITICVSADMPMATLEDEVAQALRLAPKTVHFRLDANVTVGQVREARVLASSVERSGVAIVFDTPQ